MSIGFMVFGGLCGMTAAVLTMMAGAGWLAAFAAYAVTGSAGLVLMAVSVALRDGPDGEWPERGCPDGELPGRKEAGAEGKA